MMDTPDFSFNRLFWNSDAAREKLRIGVRADGRGVPRYARQVIEDVQACDFAEIVCLIETCHSADPRKIRSHDGLLYRVYQRWFSPPPAAPLNPVETVDHDLYRESIARFSMAPAVDNDMTQPPADALASIRALDLDVILDFGRLHPDPALTTCPRFGIWRLNHGDTTAYRGGPPMLWELIENHPLTGVVLRRLGDKPNDGQILMKARFATADTISAAVNGYGPIWSTTHFVIEKLRELHRKGWTHLAAAAPSERRYFGRRKAYTAPRDREMLQWLLPLASRATVRRLRTLLLRLAGRSTMLHWRLGLRRSDLPLFEEPSPAGALRSFHWVDSPRGRFWADPFLLPWNGQQLVFFEDYDYATRLGAIAVAELSPDGRLSGTRVVLKQRYHLSYPQVFEHAGEMWMIPESSESGAIELWRARHFPDDWVLEKRLVEIRAVDATILHDGGRWWLFASPMPVMGYFAQTYLWSADHLTGPWRLHEQGAVCSDVSNARPAGRIILAGDKLLRPSQDCTGLYGRALCFNSIERLDEVAYAERPFLRISSSRIAGLTGLHTFSRCGDWEAIDGLFRWPARLLR